MKAVQESRNLLPLPTVSGSPVEARDGHGPSNSMSFLNPPNHDIVPYGHSDDAKLVRLRDESQSPPPKEDATTPLFRPPPSTSNTCQMITTTMTYSEPGVSPWPYTGCLTSISDWIPAYTIVKSTSITDSLVTTPAGSTSSTITSETALPSPPQSPPEKSHNTAIIASTAFVGVALVAGIVFLIWYKKIKRSRKGGDANAWGLRSTTSSSTSAGVPYEMNRVSGAMPLKHGGEPMATAGFEDVRSSWTTGGHRDYGFSRGAT